MVACGAGCVRSFCRSERRRGNGFFFAYVVDHTQQIFHHSAEIYVVNGNFRESESAEIDVNVSVIRFSDILDAEDAFGLVSVPVAVSYFEFETHTSYIGKIDINPERKT